MKRQRGSTFMEVLVGLAIIALVVPSLLGLFVAAARAGHVSRYLVVSTNLAEGKIEILRSLAFEDLIDIGEVVEEDVEGFRGFTRRVSIHAFGPSLAQVAVAVWANEEPRASLVEIETLIRRRQPVDDDDDELSDEVQFILDENVFVYGSALQFGGGSISGAGATAVITGGLHSDDLNRGSSIAVTYLYIDGDVTLSGGSASLGSEIQPGEIHVNGDLELWTGTRSIYGDVYVNGNLRLKDARLEGGGEHGAVYVDGDVELGWTPTLAADLYVYYTGSFIHPPTMSPDITAKFIHQDTVPPARVPSLGLPSLRADSWYQDRGYRTDDPPLSDDILIVSDDYVCNSGGSARGVVVVSRGDITVTGWRTSLSGIFFAPNGRITFQQGVFEVIVLSRDGFFYTAGGGSVVFTGLDDLFDDPADYPFE